MKRLIRNLPGLPTEDNRGLGTGTTAAGAAGALVIVAAITAGIAVPSDVSDKSNPQAQVNVVKDGLRDSLEETNNEVVNKDQAADNSRSRQIAAHVRRAIPEHAWNNLPAATRNRLTQQLGSFMSQVDAQASIDSELTHVESAGDGMVRGAVIKQHGTGSHTITDTVKETYQTTEHRIDHWERYIKRYEQRVTGTRRVQVGTRQVQVGTTRKMKPVAETYQTPVYDTRRVTHFETETYQIRVRHVSYERKCSIGAAVGSTCSMVRDVYYTTETRTRMVKTWETERYISHYETHTRVVTKWVTVPVYETRPVYERQPITKTVPVYDRRPVYKTVNIQKTRTKTVQKKVETAPFVIENGDGDWTLATGVKDSRDASMRIEKSMLTENQANAFQLVAASQSSGETWTMSVWKDDNEIVIRTNNGIQRRVSGEFAEINFDQGTINGQNANIQLAKGLEGPYDLKVKNGKKARGTFKMVINGNPSVKAQVADVANDEAGLTVVDGIVYSATFDVTYESGDTTYTDRVKITPAVKITDSPDPSQSQA